MMLFYVRFWILLKILPCYSGLRLLSVYWEIAFSGLFTLVLGISPGVNIFRRDKVLVLELQAIESVSRGDGLGRGEFS